MKTESHWAIHQILAPALAMTALFSACSSTPLVSDVEKAPAAHSAQDNTMPASFQLPPGWTEADMQACAQAATPGAMHEWLAKSVGTWKGTSTMWMAPGTEPMVSPVSGTCTKVMDGRYTRFEYSGDMPGMGPFHGLGFYGFDNVSQRFVSTWMDNCGTGIMRGEGQLSADGKAIEWKCEYNCPIKKGRSTMREIERHDSDDSMTLEMSGPDPKTGQEFMMMKIEMKREHGS